MDSVLAGEARTQATPVAMVMFGLAFIAVGWAQYFAMWHIPWLRSRGPAQHFGRPIMMTVIGVALIVLGTVGLVG